MLQLYTLTDAELAAEREEADLHFRGIAPRKSTQTEGKPLPISPQRVKLSHFWWVGADTNVVESCGKQECRVCSPDHGPYLHGVIDGSR
jgi:hypothetical protein